MAVRNPSVKSRSFPGRKAYDVLLAYMNIVFSRTQHKHLIWVKNIFLGFQLNRTLPSRFWFSNLVWKSTFFPSPSKMVFIQIAGVTAFIPHNQSHPSIHIRSNMFHRTNRLPRRPHADCLQDAHVGSREQRADRASTKDIHCTCSSGGCWKGRWQNRKRRSCFRRTCRVYLLLSQN